MKKRLTELVFILDRSGSMAGLESDTIGGFNSVLMKQKKEAGDANITTVLFDDQYEMLHDRYNLREVSNITAKEYFVRGTTALLDAVGKTISKMIHVQRRATEEERAEKVMFVIITDGLENASVEYSYNQINKMIDHQKKNYEWEFIFLGANIDAAEVADRFGIAKDRAANYHADSKGTRLNYDVISDTVSQLREKGSVASDWKEKIDQDYEKRKKR
ncbi:vWA domain-containing protein [Isachenkonia alkalipeptolytica]|uniref:VWA domain-containing protein n=1 Tax=Isachenkonia alkalipeptolytica TaxID=2565777 RepID=A0AA44BE88_9CLOT|nr:vWA domain-containing protein [Isachenkonia alkalipeptolytica]NBG87221.1 VWA domain-containing protein [Isachenkonia alkalipeptolytica]